MRAAGLTGAMLFCAAVGLRAQSQSGCAAPFPVRNELRPPLESIDAGARLHAGLGFASASDRLRTAIGRLRNPAPRADTSGLAGRVDIALRTRACIASRFTSVYTPDDLRIQEAYAAFERWNLGAWAGVRRVAYGSPGGEPLVLSGAMPLPGVGGYLPRPIRFPWIFGALGDIHLESFLARVSSNGTCGSAIPPGNEGCFGHPWLWAFSGSMTSSRSITVGLNRAVMFGGSGNPGEMSLRNIFYLVLLNNLPPRDNKEDKLAAIAFANQLLSVDVIGRVSVASGTLSPYVEWAMDDGSGAWHETPGIRAGLRFTRPDIGEIGFERTSIVNNEAEGHPPFYTHGFFLGGWTQRRTPLATSLGGHGNELRVYATNASTSAGARFRVDVFRRYRGAANLYAPAWQGTATGAVAAFDVILRQGFALRGELAYERGASAAWSTSSVLATAEWRP